MLDICQLPMLFRYEFHGLQWHVAHVQNIQVDQSSKEKAEVFQN